VSLHVTSMDLVCWNYSTSCWMNLIFRFCGSSYICTRHELCSETNTTKNVWWVCLSFKCRTGFYKNISIRCVRYGLLWFIMVLLKAPIHTQLFVRPLSDSSLTEGQFSPTYIQITGRQKPSGRLSFVGTVCMGTRLPADVRQPTEGNL
jgi:hypothetical protein